MSNKVVYTRVFLSQLGKSTNLISVNEHIPLWWSNTRKNRDNGLRLTAEGLSMIQGLDIQIYDIPFPKEMSLTSEVLVYLDEFINCPYYISRNSIVVTSERKAVELTLFSGDIRRYGIIKAMKKDRVKTEYEE